MSEQLRKAGSNWVDGDRFFDRKVELEALAERVRDGTHTLLTAQRRMGKTSLVRELLRRLGEDGHYETIFVDLEDAQNAEDAITEIAVQAQSVQTAWQRVAAWPGNFAQSVGQRVEELGVSELRVRLRASVDAGSWRRRGDDVFGGLAAHNRPVVLAIDELPILVNRMLKGSDFRITPERRESADLFLSWLRRNAQTHRGAVCLMVSGSVGLEPILREASLSAHANIFSPFQLRPWTRDVSTDCLKALAMTYGLSLPLGVRQEMCDRLRCCVPHHVQQFFDQLHEHLRREGRTEALLRDVGQVYERELLGVRGQIDLEHYETRLRIVLGPENSTAALELLTEAAVNDGRLTYRAIEAYRREFGSARGPAILAVEDILYILEHDGYLDRDPGGFRFVSGLLEDWWRARYGAYFTPIEER